MNVPEGSSDKFAGFLPRRQSKVCDFSSKVDIHQNVGALNQSKRKREVGISMCTVSDVGDSHFEAYLEISMNDWRVCSMQEPNALKDIAYKW